MPRYSITVTHGGLNKFRIVQGNDLYIVNKKAELQQVVWNEIWEKKSAIQKNQNEIIEKKEKSKSLTQDAKLNIEILNNILKYTLNIDDKIVWDSLKDLANFRNPEPKKTMAVKYPQIPPKERFSPEFSIIDIFSKKSRNKKNEDSNTKYAIALEEWKIQKIEIDKINNKLLDNNKELLDKWESDRMSFYNQQKENNVKIDKLKDDYFKKLQYAIIEYCDLVLSRSNYPDYFPQEYELTYIEDTGVLVVDYFLPEPEQLPKIKEVKYNKTSDEFVEIYLAEIEQQKIYDNTIYQISLRTVHELYEADVVNALHSIVFNGMVKSIDKGTGKEVIACIVTIQANKQVFLEINLSQVDPKACFKSLKGIGSSKLISLTPVAPIININRDDKRFIDSYGIANGIHQETNLAAMDWQDFEHLIRELFEKEFRQSGGEVKVTQSSRDGGVDAVAFDPDPIRGGKIVIQSKRYTNVVGVSAVRDLYGTVMNEGATKGILVTTSHYGSDAYEFAKGKPLTLLDGSNLLYLLEKHGHKAKIDIQEAKRISSS